MAKVSKDDESNKKPKIIKKKQQTVRERAASGSKSRPQRVRRAAGKVASPLGRARGLGKKEYHMPLPDNRAGTILSKRVRLTPRFLRESWQEIRQVTWPGRKETVRLTIAVFIFSVIFAVIVGLLDYGLDKLFREVILK